jgi:hypothetical protein
MLRRPGFLVLALPALIALSTTACGKGVVEAGPGSGAGAGAGMCAMSVEFNGQFYDGASVAVAPEQGERLGTATIPPCNDTGPSMDPEAEQQVPVAAVPGVDPAIAVMWVDRVDCVLIRRGTTDLPPELTRLQRPVACATSDGTISLAGPWLGIMAANGDIEADLVPPYDLQMMAQDASEDQYRRAFLSVRVPKGVPPPLSQEDVASSLSTGGTIRVTVHCVGDRYVADHVQASPPA